jgi:hypothetical protein
MVWSPKKIPIRIGAPTCDTRSRFVSLRPATISRISFHATVRMSSITAQPRLLQQGEKRGFQRTRALDLFDIGTGRDEQSHQRRQARPTSVRCS